MSHTLLNIHNQWQWVARSYCFVSRGHKSPRLGICFISCNILNKSYKIVGLRILILFFPGATSRDAMLSLRFAEDSAGLLTLTLFSMCCFKMDFTWQRYGVFDHVSRVSGCRCSIMLIYLFIYCHSVYYFYIKRRLRLMIKYLTATDHFFLNYPKCKYTLQISFRKKNRCCPVNRPVKKYSNLFLK